MLDGRMRHEDVLGNRGDLGLGDAQWMTAGHGIIHSEMPQQAAGRMRGSSCGSTCRRAKKCGLRRRHPCPHDIPTVALRVAASCA